MPSFSPLIASDPSCLILGSMPGQISLQKTEYYAHPQNAFWWIMAQIGGFTLSHSYQQNCEKMTQAGYAVWDVLYECSRLGSLDKNIHRASEQANDFIDFFSKHKTIRRIAFNGAAANDIFMRHCAESLTAFPYLTWVQLPSSSPAHARITRAQKLQLWQSALLDPITI